MSIKIKKNIIEVSDGINPVYEFDWLRLSKYWDYATLEDNEIIRASYDEKYLTVILLTAQGQGGIVAIVDMGNDTIIHIHDAAFALKAIICEDKVITLSDVTCFGQSPYLFIDVIDLENMEFVEPLDGMKLEDYKNLDIDSLKMYADTSTGNIKIDDGKESFEINISNLL